MWILIVVYGSYLHMGGTFNSESECLRSVPVDTHRSWGKGNSSVNVKRYTVPHACIKNQKEILSDKNFELEWREK